MCYITQVSLRSAILGFLDLAPSTGYLLQQRFEGSVGSFWSATQSQIYRELHALEKGGQVQVEVVPQAGKPARKVYALTDAGREELGHWLRAPVEPPQLRDPLLLKLVFAAELPAPELERVLTQYAESLRATRSEYQARLGAPEIFALARSPREALLWELSLDNGLAWCEAQIAWTERALQRLSHTSKRSPRTGRTPKPRKRGPT